MLELRDVVKKFDSFRLGPLSLNLRAYGLLGPNGAGKTTLLHLIAAQIRLSAGSISLDDKPLQWGDAKWKKNICLIRERPAFYEELTVDETLRFAASLYREWDQQFATDAMKRLSLESSQIISTMSNGTKVKLGLVVALAFRAKVLMLDEPTAGLDPTARAELQDLLLEIRQSNPNTTLIVSSHIFEDIERVSQEIILLQNGQVLLNTNFEELSGSSIIILPPESMLNVPDARLTWIYKDCRHFLVHNESPALNVVGESRNVKIIPASNNLTLIYTASEDYARQ